MCVQRKSVATAATTTTAAATATATATRPATAAETAATAETAAAARTLLAFPCFVDGDGTPVKVVPVELLDCLLRFLV